MHKTFLLVLMSHFKIFFLYAYILLFIIFLYYRIFKLLPLVQKVQYSFSFFDRFCFFFTGQHQKNIKQLHLCNIFFVIKLVNLIDIFMLYKKLCSFFCLGKYYTIIRLLCFYCLFVIF
jgi:hypothetical protein